MFGVSHLTHNGLHSVLGSFNLVNMHGVSELLPGLSDFVGSRLHAVDDVENVVYFRFSGTDQGRLEIGVESQWTVRDASGAVVASGQPRPNAEIPSPPVGSLVVAAETRPPSAVLFRLLSGHTLWIFDTSDQLESFCIPHAGVYV